MTRRELEDQLRELATRHQESEPAIAMVLFTLAGSIVMQNDYKLMAICSDFARESLNELRLQNVKWN